MKTRCHFWIDDGTVDFDYGPLYEDIPDDLIEEYKRAEVAFYDARHKLWEAVQNMTPIKTNDEFRAEIKSAALREPEE